MTKTRLNEMHRIDIRNRVMADTLDPITKDLREQQTAMFWRLVNAVYGEEGARALTLIEKTNGLRDAIWYCSSQNIIIDGLYRNFTFGDSVPRIGLGVSTFTGRHQKLGKEALALHEQWEAHVAKKTRAESELCAMLQKARTFEELLAAWPEGKKYIEPVLTGALAGKPSTALVSFADINKTLGLPKDEAA